MISVEGELAVDTIDEEQKFLQSIKPDAWLEDMLSVRNTFLHTTLFSKEIRKNLGNDNDAFDSLLGGLPETYPVLSVSLHIG